MQRLVTDERMYTVVDQTQVNQDILKLKFYPYFIGQNSSIIAKVFFQDMRHYCQQLIRRLTSKGIPIKEEHLPNLSPDEDLSESYFQTQKEISTKQKILWTDLAQHIFMGPLRQLVVLCFLSYLLDQMCKSSISLILYIIIQKVQHREIQQAALYIMISLILYLLALIGIHHGFNKAMQFSSKSRMILVNLLYQKMSNLNAYTIKIADEGQILNVITGGISGLEFNLIMMFQSTVIPFALIYDSGIMWYRFDGPIGMLALLISLITLPIQMLIQKRNENYLINAKYYQDERIKLTNQFIDNIRLIKMYCWQEAFINIIQTTRQKEFKNVLKIQLFSMFERVISNSSSIWASIIFFCIIYFGGFKEDISTPEMIATLQLMATFKQACIFMASYSVQAFIGIRLSFQRICDMLNIQNKEMQCLQQNNDILLENRQEGEFLQIKNFSSYWSDKQISPTLYEINLSINKGEIWGIVGKVGSGKSTFLNCFLGEVPLYKGSIQINGKEINNQNIKFAYVEQEPFIFPDSIKNNILFGRQFNKKLYKLVLFSSCLQEDLINFQEQDNTEIGEKGLNLSGGQKARLSLARALYTQADIYLLDDPFSAVDSAVAQHIFNIAIKDFIKNQQNKPIVLLVTHSVQYINECDKILILDQGKVLAQGEYNNIRQQLKEFNHELSEQMEKHGINLVVYKKSDSAKFKRSKSTKSTQILLEQSQENNSVLQTYLRYFKYWGYPQILLIIILNIGVEAITQFFFFTVASYNSYTDKSQAYYLMLYFLVGLISFNCIKYLLTVIFIQLASNRIHKQMIRSISKASINYFDINPSGRILNRFSNDLFIADTQTSSTLIDVFEIFCSFSACLITLCLFQPYFIILAVTIYVLDGFLFIQFKSVINQMKQVELLAKSPMVIFFKKTIQGIIQIRIYQQQQWFRTQFLQITNQLQLSQLCYFYVVRCFGFHIDLIGFIIQVIGYYLILELNNDNLIRFSQSILLLCTYNDFIQWGLRQLITFETEINSYSRMFEIIDIKPEEEEQKLFINDFPQDGSLEFNNVQFRYREKSELVLKGMSFQIMSGEKIGCVGRTGAGKSSIIQVIFRMCEIENDENSWIKISNINTQEISLQQLRQSISIIPQQPFLFSGSIKGNLDPFNKYSEQQIWSVLEEVNLKNTIEILNKSLNTAISDFNSIFSVGQKQLICLARVILNKKKIIILDEATANIDMKTDEYIQQIIKNNFKECTIITIAHRLNTIADYDKVMVIQDGTVAEFDHPYNLLAENEESVTIDKNSVFSKLVQDTGNQNSQVIFDIAKKSRMSQ